MQMEGGCCATRSLCKKRRRGLLDRVLVTKKWTGLSEMLTQVSVADRATGLTLENQKRVMWAWDGKKRQSTLEPAPMYIFVHPTIDCASVQSFAATGMHLNLLYLYMVRSNSQQLPSRALSPQLVTLIFRRPLSQSAWLQSRRSPDSFCQSQAFQRVSTRTPWYINFFSLPLLKSSRGIHGRLWKSISSAHLLFCFLQSGWLEWVKPCAWIDQCSTVPLFTWTFGSAGGFVIFATSLNFR